MNIQIIIDYHKAICVIKLNIICHFFFSCLVCKKLLAGKYPQHLLSDIEQKLLA